MKDFDMSDTPFPGADRENPVTTYLPQQWCDEIIPVTQPDPNIFLRQVNGNWFLIPEEYETGNEDGYRIAVAHGDLIAFESYRDYGQSQISVADDASYTLREPFPDDANWFVFLDGDFYNGADTIPETIKLNREEGPDSFTPPYETEIIGVFFGETTTFRVVIEEENARLEKLPEPPLVIPYTNWRGETAIRHLRPIGVKFKSTSYHREPQWILEAFDYEKQAMRSFAMKDFGGNGDGLFLPIDMAERHFSIGHESGDVFRADDDYDGLTLTIEVKSEAEATAILSTIALKSQAEATVILSAIAQSGKDKGENP